MSFIYKLIVNTLIFVVFHYLLPNGLTVKDWTSAIVAAVVLALLNTFLKPLLHFISLPITFISLGLFSIVINMIVLAVDDSLVSGITIHGWGWVFILSLIFSFAQSWLTSVER
ncbi:phage holin family protein [Oenococcus sicerae]|uniref:Phage holin family protein n=1 Tax=Oenococcus sicerae TaxID=2203724 RepID=A0AAJ1VPM5_9LACO|nr:phage holin family protein [Oenococcus sicerae]MDN6900969.1 phage holin family protein [Oenococcus sicerae]